MWASSQILARTPDWSATFHVPDIESDRYSGKVLVSFGEIGSDLNDIGFGAKIASKMGVQFLNISQRKGTQYQFLGRDDFCEVVDYPALQGKDLYLYGTSLGGYCALYYGRPVGASILALAPRIPAHPIIRRMMAVRFPNEGYLHGDINSGYEYHESGNQYILYDQYNCVDNFYVETQLKPSFNHASFRHVEGAGHYVPKALSLSGHLKGVLESFMSDSDIDYNIDVSSVLSWHSDRCREFARLGKMGYASEHLSALIGRASADEVRDLADFCNSQLPERRATNG